MGLMDKLRGIARAKPGITPVRRDELMEKLMGLNHEQNPFKVEKGEDVDLVAGWKIVDASWYEVFAKANLEKTHKILLALDEDKREVKMLEESYSVEWRSGTPSISMKAEKFQGRTSSTSSATRYAFQGANPLSFEQVYHYRFDVSEMKDPIKEVVIGAGWDLIPVMLKRSLT